LKNDNLNVRKESAKVLYFAVNNEDETINIHSFVVNVYVLARY